MNDMDEISFWINTKRAPCLFYIDSLSSSKPESIHSVPDIPLPKKKKRKLSILDDESALSEKQQNLYFDSSQTKNQPVNGCASSTDGSDIDFNIKKSSVQDKRKRCKLQRSSRTTLHKKNKLVTSTPKPPALRRSLRKVQSSVNNNSQLNTSYDIFSGSVNYNNGIEIGKKPETQCEKIAYKQCVGDQTVPRKSGQEIISRPIVANDRYEDLSDVSGFTANYIRSTKIHSKTPHKVKAKTARNFMKESHDSPKESRMVICVNKSVNTGLPQDPRLNCSTDSSQNVLNLVTIKNNSKLETADKGTSLLKFVDNKKNLDCSKETHESSFSKTTTSRYPKRNKTIINLVTINERTNVDKRKSGNRNTCNNSDKKENPEKLSRTRSGRALGLSLRQKDNSVLVVNNSEMMSSTASINVGSPTNAARKTRTPRRSQVRNSNGRSQQQSRDKSGFAQCFSDSDDNDPRKQRKYFC